MSEQFQGCTSVDQMVDKLVDRLTKLANDCEEQPETDVVDSGSDYD